MSRNNRILENPSERRDIRADFPSVKIYRPDDIENTKRLLDTLEKELAKHGESLDTVDSITVAYPHKHPGLFPEYKNRATDHVAQFIQTMLDANPGIKWRTADSICETRKLNRSKDQTSVHSLTARQDYTVHLPSQKEPLPFIGPDHKKTSFFVIVDDAVLQGSTVANLMSYIEHNGGKVLMVSARESIDGAAITPVAGTAGYPGRLNEMATAFSESARTDNLNWSPETCLKKFESAIRPHGLRLTSLTDGECAALIRTIRGQERRDDTGPKVSFVNILKQLHETAPDTPKPVAKTNKHQTVAR